MLNQQKGEIQQPDSNTIARDVEFREQKCIDVSWMVLYGLSYVAFIVTGCIIWSSAHLQFNIDSNGLRTLREYYERRGQEMLPRRSLRNYFYHFNTDNDALNSRL